MTINIQKASNVTVIGRNHDKHCKAVYNITTGEMYASGIDAANALGVDQGTVSAALNERIKTCKGMRLCFVAKMMEHLEEINEANRLRAAKVAAYDADAERRNAIVSAEADVKKYEEMVADLRCKLESAEGYLEAAVRKLRNLKNCD